MPGGPLAELAKATQRTGIISGELKCMLNYQAIEETITTAPETNTRCKTGMLHKLLTTYTKAGEFADTIWY